MNVAGKKYKREDAPGCVCRSPVCVTVDEKCQTHAMRIVNRAACIKWAWNSRVSLGDAGLIPNVFGKGGNYNNRCCVDIK